VFWLGATPPLLGAASIPPGAVHDCDGAAGVCLDFGLGGRRGRENRSKAWEGAGGKKSGQERATRHHSHSPSKWGEGSTRRGNAGMCGLLRSDRRCHTLIFANKPKFEKVTMGRYPRPMI
jgi:hypothetical protein